MGVPVSYLCQIYFEKHNFSWVILTINYVMEHPRQDAHQPVLGVVLPS